MKLLGQPRIYLKPEGLNAWRIITAKGLLIGVMSRQYSVFHSANLYTIEVNGWSYEPMRHADACEWLSEQFDTDVTVADEIEAE